MTNVPAWWAGPFSALTERNFRLFFIGNASSLVGSGMVPIALTFAVLDRHGTVTQVGYVLAAQTLPMIALVLVGGVLADRLPRRLAMLGADLARCVSEAALAVLLLTDRAPFWSIVIAAAVLGAGQALFRPALTGLMPEIVPAEKLQQANALRGAASSAAQIVGPALGGAIVAAAGPGWAIAIDAASYAVSAACLGRIRMPAHAVAAESMLAELVAGWREFISRSWLRTMVIQYAAFNALSISPFLVLGVAIARDRLGGAGAWGGILASLGAGSIIGGLVSTRLQVRRPLVVASIGAASFSLPEALLAIPAPAAAIAAAAAVAGLGLTVESSLWETSLQRHIPRELISRVSAYDWLGSAAFVPVGYLIAGPASETIGARPTLVFGACWGVASFAVVIATRSVRSFTSAPAAA